MRNIIVLLLCLLLSSAWAISPREDAPEVSTSLGRIRGSILQTFHGKTIYAFRGIRYAEAPVGELRFAEPQPADPWGGEVYKATSDSLVCPQKGLAIFMSEDCLKINVYTKNFNARLPVIVYIHGGANVLGSGHSLYEAGPQYLLDQEVVFVSFNYRLGALGFLSTGAKTAYNGNYGYLDQVLALQWVQDHISNFGGNASLVTILGMSAGAMGVSLHLASPLSTGLFHRAILMSGSATNHYSIDNVYWTRKLARELGCPMYEPETVVTCLRNATWKRIIELCAAWETYQFINMKWNYEIDGEFLPKHPSDLIASGNFNRVPLLVSYTANELDYTTYGHLSNENLLHDINENFVEYAPELYLFDYDKNKSQRIKEFYLGQNVSAIDDENIESFGRIFSDAIIGHGVYRLVNLARRHTNIYYSRMEFVGQRSLSAPLNSQNVSEGVGHADDLQYIMPGLWYGTQMSQNSSDVFMMERLTSWFAHFAKEGQPMASSQDWPPCSSSAIKLLHNDATTRMGSAAYVDRYALWDDLFPKSGSERTLLAFSQLCLVAVVVLMLKLM